MIQPLFVAKGVRKEDTVHTNMNIVFGVVGLLQEFMSSTAEKIRHDTLGSSRDAPNFFECSSLLVDKR